MCVFSENKPVHSVSHITGNLGIDPCTPAGRTVYLDSAQKVRLFVSRLYHDRFIEILAGLFDSLDDFGSHLAKDLRLAQVPTAATADFNIYAPDIALVVIVLLPSRQSLVAHGFGPRRWIVIANVIAGKKRYHHY
jgi:hypothetical protein